MHCARRSMHCAHFGQENSKWDILVYSVLSPCRQVKIIWCLSYMQQVYDFHAVSAIRGVSLPSKSERASASVCICNGEKPQHVF